MTGLGHFLVIEDVSLAHLVKSFEAVHKRVARMDRVHTELRQPLALLLFSAVGGLNWQCLGRSE